MKCARLHTWARTSDDKRITTYHIQSYHIVSYHIISYLITSYRITTCHIRKQLSICECFRADERRPLCQDRRRQLADLASCAAGRGYRCLWAPLKQSAHPPPHACHSIIHSFNAFRRPENWHRLAASALYVYTLQRLWRSLVCLCTFY